MCPQSIWYFGAARILYEGRPAWNSNEPLPDMSPAMFVPGKHDKMHDRITLSAFDTLIPDFLSASLI